MYSNAWRIFKTWPRGLQIVVSVFMLLVFANVLWAWFRWYGEDILLLFGLK